jgi:hypothetical protein
MADNLEAVLPCDLLLKPLDLIGPKFDHLPRFYIDEVIVVFRVGAFEARRSASKNMPLEDAFFLEKAKCPVDRRKRDAWVDFCRTPMQFQSVGMITRLLKKFNNYASLTRQAKAAFFTDLDDINRIDMQRSQPIVPCYHSTGCAPEPASLDPRNVGRVEIAQVPTLLARAVPRRTCRRLWCSHCLNAN